MIVNASPCRLSGILQIGVRLSWLQWLSANVEDLIPQSVPARSASDPTAHD